MTPRKRAARASLGDAADAFFQEGDEGTYEGGPADSLVPVVAPDFEDEPLALPSPEQLARRRHLRRMVMAGVGGLGSVLVLVLSVRLVRSAVEADADELGAQPPSVVELARPAPPETVAAEPSPSPVVEAIPAPDVEKPSEPAQPAAPSTAAPARKARLAAHQTGRASAPSEAEPETRPIHARRSTVTQVAAPGARRWSSAPPTASFPD